MGQLSDKFVQVEGKVQQSVGVFVTEFASFYSSGDGVAV